MEKIVKLSRDTATLKGYNILFYISNMSRLTEFMHFFSLKYKHDRSS